MINNQCTRFIIKISCSHKSINNLILSAATTFLITHFPLATAEQVTSIYIDIPPQSLDMALNQFKRQTGVPTVYNPEQLRTKNSSLVNGYMTPYQALNTLLAGTDWVAQSSDGVIHLHAQHPNPPGTEQEKPVILPELLIKQTREASYVTEQSSTATRIPAPIQDVPRSIGVVTRNVIEDQKAFRIDEAIRNVSGTSMSSTQGGRAGDFMIRGFRSDLNVFKNGFREDSTYGARASRDTANIESIEVVKGPPLLSLRAI